jgi:hypothetical protein
LTGKLEAGSDYEFALWAYIYQETETGTDPASATGMIELDLTDVPQVPVPAAAWLFASALLGLAASKRSKRLSH